MEKAIFFGNVVFLSNYTIPVSNVTNVGKIRNVLNPTS